MINQSKFKSFENINIKINHLNKNIQIIIIYKPPNTSKREFLDEFGGFLDTVLIDSRNILICGDFNLHVDNKADNYVKEFLEILESHNLENCVDDPTTLSNHLIDLVIQNKDSNIVSGLEVEPDCTISPVHKLISFNVNIWRSTVVKKTITYRNKNNFDAETYIDESIKKIDENRRKCKCISENRQIDEETCVSCYTASRKNILAMNYNDICPEINKQIIIKENAKWFNSELREAKKKKRRLEDKWKRSNRLNKNKNWEVYKTARNQYYALIEKTKRIYYNKEINETNNPRKIHACLDDLLGLKKDKILPLNHGDGNVLANNFVNFFEEKIERICLSLDEESALIVTTDSQTSRPNIKFNKFRISNMEEFNKITSKLKNTFCKYCPFLISDLKRPETLAGCKIYILILLI